MEELINLIATDGSASDTSDRIEGFLYTKDSDRIDSILPEVATIMFNSDDQTGEDE